MSDLGSEQNPIRVAIVGSGPSGFYAMEALIRSEPAVLVDMFERLPSPFELDHHLAVVFKWWNIT